MVTFPSEIMKKRKFGLRSWQKFLLGFFLAWIVGCVVQLKLERGGPWAMVGALPSAIFAPVGLPILSYQEMFRSKEVTKQALKSPNSGWSNAQYDDAGKAGSRKGLLFGVLQVAAFYLPFFLPAADKEPKTEVEEGGSNE